MITINKVSNTSNPCFQCPNRAVGCHANCERYSNFKNKTRDYNHKIIEARHSEYVFRNYVNGKLY